MKKKGKTGEYLTNFLVDKLSGVFKEYFKSFQRDHINKVFQILWQINMSSHEIFIE